MDPVLSLLSTFYPKLNDETDKLTDRPGERGTEKEIPMNDKNGGQTGYSVGSNISAEIRVGIMIFFKILVLKFYFALYFTFIMGYFYIFHINYF